MSQEDGFSAFSDAVMTLMASRSHEWLAWEIAEGKLPDDDGPWVRLRIILRSLEEGRPCRQSESWLWLQTPRSPSEFALEALQTAISGYHPTPPQQASFFCISKLRNSQGIGALTHCAPH